MSAEEVEATRWASKRYGKLLRARAHRVLEFKNLYAGRRIWCLGAGPSLLRQDPRRLEGEIVASTNAAGGWLATGGISPTFSVCTDRRRLVELQGELTDPLFVFPTGVKDMRGARRFIGACQTHPSWIPLRGYGPNGWRTSGRPTFDPSRGVEHCGKSVIFMAVQLAVWMGARSVVLLGVDMDYSGPATHCTAGLNPRNVGDIYNECRPAFEQFRDALAARGIEFLNATDGGRIDVLPRADFNVLTERKD